MSELDLFALVLLSLIISIRSAFERYFNSLSSVCFCSSSLNELDVLLSLLVLFGSGYAVRVNGDFALFGEKIFVFRTVIGLNDLEICVGDAKTLGRMNA